MSAHQLLDLAMKLRARAASAGPSEREDLLFLANEYEAMAARSFKTDQAEPVSVILPN
ncbi:hypothetical protein LQ954_01375 [Sphingomonas sp. IC-11]|uniref:hypothetical protein n=1 Tax=Sphingomonas sp. IC-11 TaxID=2898528 RepID=UPI001E4CDDED|nr:hypothetical protein [Sphingomonas sp. IC-11]MCD2314794.1 hypothetical protein [Sphingomonas sp. IC-11]